MDFVKEKKEIEQPLVNTELVFEVRVFQDCLSVEEVSRLRKRVESQIDKIDKHFRQYFSSFGFCVNADDDIRVDYILSTSQKVSGRND